MFKKRYDRRVNSRKIMYSTLAFVLVGITTMTLAYATLSTTLKITGSAEFQEAGWSFVIEEYEIPSDWEVPVENINGNTITYGKAKLLEKPTISGTSINDFKISIGQIGDEVYQEYILKNTGDVPAYISSYTYNDFEIIAENEEDKQLVIENFVGTVGFFEYYKDENGEWIPGDYYDEYADVLICPGGQVGVELVTIYSPSAPRIPYGQASISNLDVEFILTATDQNYCEDGEPVEEQ